jgi:hypothetical protein
MVKVLRSWNLWNWRGLVLGLAQAAIIGMVVWVSSSFSSIAQGAKMGRQSLEKVNKVDQRVDSLAAVQSDCQRKQDVVNIGIIKDVDWIKQSLIRIENKLD